VRSQPLLRDEAASRFGRSGDFAVQLFQRSAVQVHESAAGRNPRIRPPSRQSQGAKFQYATLGPPRAAPGADNVAATTHCMGRAPGRPCLKICSARHNALQQHRLDGGQARRATGYAFDQYAADNRRFRKSRASSNEHADGEIGALARISSAVTNCGRSLNVTSFAFRNAHMRIQNPPVSKKVPIDWSRDHSAACQLTRVMWPLRARGNNGLGGIILRTMPEAGVRCSFREAPLPP
jgi:hypothetical protein